MLKNYPLYDVRTIRDLRDMLNQSVEIWPDHPAFLWKNGSPVYQPITFKEYQEGMKLLKNCHEAIEEVELKVQKIAENGSLEDFE